MYSILLILVTLSSLAFVAGYCLSLRRVRDLQAAQGDLEEDLRRAKAAIQKNDSVPSQNSVPTVADLVRLARSVETTVLPHQCPEFQLHSIRGFDDKMGGNIFNNGAEVETHSFKEEAVAYRSILPIDPTFSEHLQAKLGMYRQHGQVRVCVEEGLRGGVELTLRAHPFIYNGPVLLTICDLDGELMESVVSEAEKIIYEDQLHRMPGGSPSKTGNEA